MVRMLCGLFKTAALEARVAELEQQVDELKNKD